jgi:hypothetical protein
VSASFGERDGLRIYVSSQRIFEMSCQAVSVSSVVSDKCKRFFCRMDGLRISVSSQRNFENHKTRKLARPFFYICV